MFTINTKTL